MDLGTNYMALAVKDIAVSKAFYEKLGFELMIDSGSEEAKWMVLHNGDVKVGLFQDMFPSNMQTFNPPDARAFYRKLKQEGVAINFASRNIGDADGACSFMVTDPDGNQILMDQHND